ncbi:four-helix bundle copper-binding protein [Alicyclobacillus fodiniaquatilis]|uniref:Four-helix bundle copper-binding protein n=1 Tax=Alicyclobacillus fodiniaquatilis TaxID=1661150 RepID=A0ABW4JQS7_9BACL
MANQEHGEFDFTPDYRSEGIPPKKPSKAEHVPHYHMEPQSSPDIDHESPSAPEPKVTEKISFEFESPVVQYVKKPAPVQPKQFAYMEYELEQEKIQLNQVDPSPFAVHPMHHCMNICEYIKDCMLMCERMMQVQMCKPDAHLRRRQIAMLQDCAEVCFLTTRQVARCSPMLRTALRYCAKVCRMCGHECMRFPDPDSQASARMTFHCADMCEKFAAQYNWH